MTDANTFVAMHTIGYNGRYYKPGELITVTEPHYVEKLLRRRAIMRPIEFKEEQEAIAERRRITK